MRAIEDNSIQTLSGIRDFLAKHAADVPEAAESGTRKELDAEFVALRANATSQAENQLFAQGATAKYRVLRKALLEDHMAPITRIARLRQGEVPALAVLRMPRGEPSREKLVRHAKALGDVAEPFTDVFVAAGLPPDFVSSMRAAADAMSDTVLERKVMISTGGGATDGIRARLVVARRLVKVLDSLVRRDIKDNVELLGAWESVCHVKKPRGRTRPPQAPGSQPEAPG